MLLTIATTHRPATDLGYLLHKNPSRPQSFDLAFGRAHVFYPEATEERCEAALLLDIDPIRLVRGPGAVLSDYVNDRPYVASSFLCVAVARVFGSALSGRSRERPELAATPIPLEAKLAAVPCRGSEELIARLFEPLGYEVETSGGDEAGRTRYRNVTLRATRRLGDLLTHVYVLLAVADNRKHYWIGEAELEKLLERGKGWLEGHPERELIVKRYLGHRRNLASEALTRLDDADTNGDDPDAMDGLEAERRQSLHELRLDWVMETLETCGAKRVVDVGCGEGQLLCRLVSAAALTEIVGADASTRALKIAARRLKLRREGDRGQGRVRLIQTGLTYRDSRLAGYDAAAVVEVIEHIDPARLETFEQALFEGMRPETILLTTPNREYNVRFENVRDDGLRHRDHRFEWTRAEFEAWAKKTGDRYRYRFETGGIGPDDPEVGPPTQRGLFRRCG